MLFLHVFQELCCPKLTSATCIGWEYYKRSSWPPPFCTFWGAAPDLKVFEGLAGLHGSVHIHPFGSENERGSLLDSIRISSMILCPIRHLVDQSCLHWQQQGHVVGWHWPAQGWVLSQAWKPLRGWPWGLQQSLWDQEAQAAGD